MNFKKIGMGIALTAAFGLMACGDDSSSSPAASADSLYCKVIDDGKTVGFEFDANPVYMKTTYTINSDGSLTLYVKESLSGSLAGAELDAACKAAKSEYEEEENTEIDSFKCGDGRVEIKATEKGEYKASDIEYTRYIAEAYCANMNGTPYPKVPEGFENFGGIGGSGDESSEGNSKGYFADDPKLCKFGLSDDVWIIKNSKYEWTDDSSYTYTNYSDKGSAQACEDYLDIASLSFDEYECDGSLLIGKEFVTREDRRDRLVAVQKINCDGDFELDDDAESSSSSDVTSSSSSEEPLSSSSEEYVAPKAECEISESSDTWKIVTSGEGYSVVQTYKFTGTTMTKTEVIVMDLQSAEDCSFTAQLYGGSEAGASCDGSKLSMASEPEVSEDVVKSEMYEELKFMCDAYSNGGALVPAED